MSPEELMEIINYVDGINLSFGATKVITDPETPKVKEIERRAMSVGVKLLHSKVRHLGIEENLKILKRIFESMNQLIVLNILLKPKDRYKTKLQRQTK